MMKKSILFLLLAVLGMAATQAQKFTVEGIVKNPDGKPVSGATVVLANTYYSTITSSKGEFKLKVKQGEYTLVVGHISYRTYKTSVTVNKDVKLTITLQPKTFITEEVIVSAQKADKEIPLPKSNIPKKKITRLNEGQDMPFILNTLPSVITTTDAGNGVGYTGIRIRGIDTRGINVTINGIPLNDAESQGVWWVDLPDLAANSENIQVQRGVGTSTNGAGAFGSTINIQTTATSKKPYAEGTLNYGSFNTSRYNVKAGTGIMDSVFAVDLSMSKIHSDGFIDRAYSNLKSLALTASYYGKNSLLKFVLLTGKEKTFQSWWGIPKEDFDAGNYTENHYKYDNATDNYQQDHYQLHYSKKITDELSLNAALHYTYGRGYYENYKDGKTLSRYLRHPVVFPGEPDTIITQNNDTVIDFPDTVYSGDLVWQKWLDNDFYGATFSVKYDNNYLNIIAGGAGNVYDGRHFGKIIWGQFIGSNNLKTDSVIQKDIEWYRGQSIKTDYNVFVKANWFVNEKINVYGDFQVRSISHKMNGYEDDSTEYDISANYVFINPKAGVSYHFSDKLNFYAFAGISHREPNRDDFIGYNHFYSKEIKPEQLLDIETGVNYSAKNIRLNLNLYRMDYENQLINTGELNDVGNPVRINVPKSFRQGIETEISVKPVQKLEIALNATISSNKIQSEFVRYYDQYDENWNWTGSVADTVRNGVLPYSPGLIAGLYVDYAPVKGLHLSVLEKYVSKQYLDNTGNPESTLPAYHTTTLKIAYNFSLGKFQNISVFASAHNLLQSKPFPTNGWVYPYYMGNTMYNDIAYYPEAVRYFNAGISIKF